MLSSRLMRSVSRLQSSPGASHEHMLMTITGGTTRDFFFPIIGFPHTYRVTVPERLCRANQPK